MRTVWQHACLHENNDIWKKKKQLRKPGTMKKCTVYIIGKLSLHVDCFKSRHYVNISYKYSSCICSLNDS